MSAYLYIETKRTSLGKVIENNLDVVYKLASGGKRFYVPPGINLELKNPDGSYLFSLYGKILDIDLSKQTLLFGDRRGRILNISLDGFLSRTENLISFKIFETTTEELIWGRKDYVLEIDDINTSKEIFCDSGLASLVWGGDQPISYWKDYLTGDDLNTVYKLQGLTINLIRDYEIDRQFKNVGVDSLLTCEI